MRLFPRGHIYLASRILAVPQISRSASTRAQKAEPLRILFCGADDFSAVSLRRLHAEQQQDSSFIESIDVVCKTGKRSGRGLKKIREVPLKSVAEELSLPVYQIPTFTGWELPTAHEKGINLVIAVSFGLRVPVRILDAAKYGGLNVHPSLLPDLRGPAPLHHAIMQGRSSTGISVQTLHPHHFDRGLVLAQEKLEIPNSDHCSVGDLRDFLAPKGADLLVQSLRENLFVTPQSIQSALPEESTAPKIQAEDARIDWKTWPSEEILRRQRAVGPLWNMLVRHGESGTSRETRVLFHDLALMAKPPLEVIHAMPAGSPQPLTTGTSGQDIVAIRTCDDKLLSIESITVEGQKKKQEPKEALTNLLRADMQALRLAKEK